MRNGTLVNITASDPNNHFILHITIALCSAAAGTGMFLAVFCCLVRYNRTNTPEYAALLRTHSINAEQVDGRATMVVRTFSPVSQA